MPITTSREHDFDWLSRHQSPTYTCDTCGGQIRVCWGGAYGIDAWILACFNDVAHTGLRRDFRLSPADTPGFNLYDAGRKRRSEMVAKHGDRVQALTKYEGVVTLSRRMAAEILEAIWPEAPAADKVRAALLCATQQLNPLMKHVFLICFNKGTDREKWEIVIGIKAKRLMASRRGPFAYIDNTPRVMTEEEQIRTFGAVEPQNLCTITKLRNPQTGAESVGYGKWPRKKKEWDEGQRKYVEVDNIPYGAEKGNDMFNMSSIHGESQGIDRLFPGEMPTEIMVMDEAMAEIASREGINENVIEGESRVVPGIEGPKEPEEITFGRQQIAEFAGKLKAKGWDNKKVWDVIWKQIGDRTVKELDKIPADVVTKVASYLEDLNSMA